jgi:prepilin-type N-terminal cleavage/methylation domain-containing protein
MKLFKNQKGFTLIELLVVIGILAVLLAITLIAINPARQFAQANNTKRSSDVNAILNAVNQYMADNKGALPASLAGCTVDAPCTITNDTTITPNVDLCSILVSSYLAGLPVDPLTNNGTAVTEANCTISAAPPVVPAYNTDYQIYQSVANNRVTVLAPTAELGASISVTR